MAIVYSAGTFITSAIVSETLGSQSGAPSDGVILATADVTPSTHTGYGGNVGNADDSFGPGDTYVGRLLAVRVGAADEESKVCTSETDNGATITLTIHGDWDSPPVSGDVLHVAYTGDDIENGGAGGGITYGRKTASWILSNDLTIGNGTDFAFFMLGTAETLEIAVEGMFVLNNGLFQCGYLFEGTPVNGAYISSEEDAAGTLYLTTNNGSLVRLYDTDLKFNIHTCYMDFQTGSDIIINDMKNYSFTYDVQMLDGYWEDVKWTGQGGTSEFVRIAEEATIDKFNLISTAGFHTEDADTSTEILTIRDVIFINNLTSITVNSNKTWNVINPGWTIDTTSQDDIEFLTAVSNIVNELYSLDVIVAEADGTLIENAKVLIYEGAKWTTPPTGFIATRILQVDTLTNASGEAHDSWMYADYIDAGPGTSLDDTQYGWLAFRTDAWLFSPFVATQTNNAKREGTVTLVPDSAISETTQATALSAGASIGWNEETNPSQILTVVSGTGTLSVGDKVTGATSGATGIVTQIVSGDSTDGEVHLRARNATDWEDLETEDLFNGFGWLASTVFPNSNPEFDIWIDANTESLQTIYDYLAAETASQTSFENTLDEYPSSNYDTDESFSGNLSFKGYGQTFVSEIVGEILSSVSFYLTRVGTAHTGTIVAKLRGTSAGSPNSLDLKDTDYQGTDSYESVAGDGTYIYVANADDGLRSYSVDALGNLTFIDVDYQGTEAYKAVWSDGTFIFVACDNAGLRCYSQSAGVLTSEDVSRPGGTGTYRGVWGDGTFIYATSINGLRSFSVDGSGNLTDIDVDYTGGGLYEKVWGDGNFIYVSCGSAGIRSFSVDDSGYLTYIDVDYQGTADYENVYADEDFIYVTAGTEGLRSYSVDGSGNLTYIMTDVQGANSYWWVWGDGDFIYVACTNDGIRSYSVDGSGILSHERVVDHGTGLYIGVWGDGTFIYCACTADGLRVYSPEMAILATSDTRLAASISSSIAIENFEFTDRYRLEPNTEYFIQVEYPTDDGASDYFNFGTDASSPTHSGTSYIWSTALDTWSADIWDSIFYVFTYSNGRDIHRWGRDEQGRALQSGANGFFTVESFSQGVFIVDYGPGTVEFFTDNAGDTWTPPSSITLEMIVKDEAGDPIETAYAYIDNDNLTPFIMNTTTNAQGEAAVAYTDGAAAGTTWRVRKYGYKAYRQAVDIAAVDISIPVTLISDPQQTL